MKWICNAKIDHVPLEHQRVFTETGTKFLFCCCYECCNNRRIKAGKVPFLHPGPVQRPSINSPSEEQLEKMGLVGCYVAVFP
jgi:hypothetical protein